MKDTKTYEIGAMLCDRDRQITIKNLLNLMLDLSFAQAKRVESNLKTMEDKSWLLYAWDIKFLKPIREGDLVVITTIPTHMRRFYAYRNFIVKRDGEVLVRAKASFILYDRSKKRASIIDKEVQRAYGEEEEAYKGEVYKISKNFTNERKIQLRKADFDKNGHVNNAIYFDYLMEIYDRKPSHIKLIYKNEIREGDEPILFYKTEDGKVDFKIATDRNHAYGVVTYV